MIKYAVFTHEGSRMPEIIPLGHDVDVVDVKRAKLVLKNQLEPYFLVVKVEKEEIEQDKAKRKRGIWVYDKGNVVYFTCPWCGSIQMTGRAYVGKDAFESLWCGYGRQPGCHRHLMLFYVKDPADPRLVYMEGSKKE